MTVTKRKVPLLAVLLLTCSIYIPPVNASPSTITTDYDGHIVFWDWIPGYLNNDFDIYIYVGVTALAKCRGYLRFPLDTIETNFIFSVSISSVEVRFYVSQAGDSGHLLDIHAYGGDAQGNPETDDPEEAYSKCAQGTPYVDDSTALRSVGWTDWIDLGETARLDLRMAESAVNRFVLGLEEEGDDTNIALISSLEKEDGNYAELRVTYNTYMGWQHVGLLSLLLVMAPLMLREKKEEGET